MVTPAIERAWEGRRERQALVTILGWRNRNLRSDPEAKEEEAGREGQRYRELRADSNPRDKEAQQRKD